VQGLEGASDGDVDVGGLVLGEGGQLGSQLGQMEGSHLFVQVLGEHVNLLLVLTRVALVPELQLGNHLQEGIGFRNGLSFGLFEAILTS
jgi:hypothetical protein